MCKNQMLSFEKEVEHFRSEAGRCRSQREQFKRASDGYKALSAAAKKADENVRAALSEIRECRQRMTAAAKYAAGYPEYVKLLEESTRWNKGMDGRK